MGYLWYEYIENKENVSDKYMLISCGFLVVLFLVLSYLFVFQFNSLMPRDAKVLNLGDIKIYSALVLSICSIMLFVSMLMKKRRRAFTSIIVMMVFIGAIALYGVLPKVNYAAQGHLNILIHVAQNYSDAEDLIVTCGLVKPSIVFYTKRQIKHFEPDEQLLLNDYLNKEERVFFITRVKYLDELSKKSNVYIIDSGRRFALFTNKPFNKNVTKKLLKGNK